MILVPEEGSHLVRYGGRRGRAEAILNQSRGTGGCVLALRVVRHSHVADSHVSEVFAADPWCLVCGGNVEIFDDLPIVSHFDGPRGLQNGARFARWSGQGVIERNYAQHEKHNAQVRGVHALKTHWSAQRGGLSLLAVRLARRQCGRVFP